MELCPFADLTVKPTQNIFEGGCFNFEILSWNSFSKTCSLHTLRSQYYFEQKLGKPQHTLQELNARNNLTTTELN